MIEIWLRTHGRTPGFLSTSDPSAAFDSDVGKARAFVELLPPIGSPIRICLRIVGHQLEPTSSSTQTLKTCSWWLAARGGT
jgi:hypothetical protein